VTSAPSLGQSSEVSQLKDENTEKSINNPSSSGSKMPIVTSSESGQKSGASGRIDNNNDGRFTQAGEQTQ
jgi:hypothetical protein